MVAPKKSTCPRAKVAMENLLAGNQRFVRGERAPGAFDLRREKLVTGQKPLAIVLGCSDSRVSPATLFDQNLGEIFVVRTVGQVLGPTVIASLEYAVDHLQSPMLMILGHEKCGAVTAAIAHEGQAPGNIGRLLGKIQPAIDRARQLNTTPEDMVERVTDLHLEELAREVLQISEIITKAVAEGRLRLVTAKYQISSGQVQIHIPDFQG